MTDALGAALGAFIREHEYCGELDDGEGRSRLDVRSEEANCPSPGALLWPERHLEPHQREAQISFLLPDMDWGAIVGEVEVTVAPLVVGPAEG